MNKNEAILIKLRLNQELTKEEEKTLIELPSTYLICYLSGEDKALETLYSIKGMLKAHSVPLYKLYKDSLRVIRKLRYD